MPARPAQDVSALLHRARWIGGIALAAAALTGVICVLTERRLERQAILGREQVRLAGDAVRDAIEREAAIRGYLLTGDSAFLARDGGWRRRIPLMLDSLVKLTEADADQHRRALRLRQAIDHWGIEYAEPALALHRTASPGLRDSLAQRDLALFAQVRESFLAFRGAELATYAARVGWAQRFYLGMLAAIIAELAIVAWILVVLLRRAGVQATALSEQRETLRQQVDERARLEQQLLQSQKLDALGRFAGGIAHDFNNLLTAIRTYADLVIDGLRPDDPLRDEAIEIRRTATRATTLTRQLLAFSRQQPTVPGQLSVNGVLAGLEQMLRRLLPASVSLELALEPRNPIVAADAGQLEQVLVNLVLNARDAMRDGGGTITITTGRDAGRAIISVADTGIGMDEETRARAFEPFFTTKPAGEGTGLGLATAYGIVRQAGGEITIDSAPGAGTRVRIELPLIARDTAPSPTAAATREALPRGSETLLLVEDDEAVRTATSRMLRRFGYDVLETASGTEALDLLARSNGAIRMVLTDLEMPGMSGADLAAMLEGWHPPVPVLIMSGHDRAAVAARLQDARTVAIIEKPFAPSDLARRVRELLDDAMEGTA